MKKLIISFVCLWCAACHTGDDDQGLRGTWVSACTTQFFAQPDIIPLTPDIMTWGRMELHFYDGELNLVLFVSDRQDCDDGATLFGQGAKTGRYYVGADFENAQGEWVTELDLAIPDEDGSDQEIVYIVFSVEGGTLYLSALDSGASHTNGRFTALDRDLPFAPMIGL